MEGNWMNPIADWLKSNWWSLLIALTTVVATYTLYGYRLDALERGLTDTQSKVTIIQASNQQTAVDIAKIQKDIEYIKLQLNRAFPPI